MSKEDLITVYESLKESSIDVEDFSWGPTYSFAMQRREHALNILKREIESITHKR